MFSSWQQCWCHLPLLPAQGGNEKSRSVRSCCSSILFHTFLPVSFSSPSHLKSNKQKCKSSKRKEELKCARCLCSGCLCFKVLLPKSCTSHDGICVSQHVQVCALKGIEAMSERRKDYCLIRWSLIICPLKLAFLTNQKILAVAQRLLC